MGLTAKEQGGEFELAPADIYTARCYRILDLGTQIGPEIFGSKKQHKVMLSWELIGKDDPKMQEGDNKGKPFSIHQKYSVSLSERATLRRDLESWRGKPFTNSELAGFDLTNVLGQYCTIQVVHSEDGKYANIGSIMKFKGDKPEPVNPDLVFDIDAPDMQVFETLSDSIKGQIMQAPEWQAANKSGYDKAKEAAGKLDKQPDQIQEPLDEIFPVDDSQPVNLDDVPF